MFFTNELTTIIERLLAGKLNRAAGFQGSALALFIALLGKHLHQPLVVISEEYQQSLALSRDVITYQQMIGTEQPPATICFPPLQRLPYQQVLPLVTVEQSRIAALHRLRHEKHYLLFTSLTALIDRMAEPSSFYNRFFTLHWGASIDREQLAEQLQNNGYIRVPTVDEPGDFSVRGSIIDLFSPLYAQPFRLDFFGDELESIRPFDPVSQKSQAIEKESVDIAPAHEILLPKNRDKVKNRLKEQFIALNDPRIELSLTYEKLERGTHFAGIDTLLPAISPVPHGLTSYLADTIIPIFVTPHLLMEKLTTLRELLTDAYEKTIARHQFAFPPDGYLLNCLEPRQLFPGRGQLMIEDLLPVDGNDDQLVTIDSRSNQDLRDAVLRFAAHQQERLFTPAADIIAGWLRQQQQVVFCGKSPSGIERAKKLLAEYDLPFTSINSIAGILQQPLATDTINLVHAPLSQGSRLVDDRLVILTETDLFGIKKAARTQRTKSLKPFQDDFSALETGSYITHIDHGIGIYRGLQTLQVEGITNDYLVLQYQGDDLVYVPVDRFHLIHAYHGNPEHAPKLTKLGSSQWDREKSKARQAIDDLLVELIDLYASRQVEKGYAYPAPDAVFDEFAASFPYEETTDQQQAITEVVDDLMAEGPMDRLICGDVGYGKTEVAIRAVFLAVTNGKQAAILVPTTILAQQHYLTFKERFAAYPLVVEMLSRFRSPQQQKEIVAGLRRGTVDVVIGTHRLLQKDIIFKDLGLLVLDEEHKFGVRHKEKLTSLKKNIDVLAMSATPIPRTLQMSLSGMRTMSSITTAPRDRLAVRTYVAAYDDDLVKEAVAKEVGRGGQVFFVHNSVQTIEAMANHLRSLLPSISLTVAHGQMPAAELEKVMVAFASHRFDLLLCTTIIESGLDIPNANTIIINKANAFGLAQLYQLRGRVGRAQKKAYAYLLVPALDQLPQDARRRLTALAEASELGAGFRIAMQDLEIRGAGNLLGKKQSGHIAAIGYELYQELLTEAVEERQGQLREKRVEPEVHINIPAYLPAPYIADVAVRLQTYKRISLCTDEQSLYLLEDELMDRFGPLPDAVQELLNQRRLKLLLMDYSIRFFEVGKSRVAIHFGPDRPPETAAIMALISEAATTYQLIPDDGLLVKQQIEGRELLPWTRNLLQKIF
ncbi:MAG: transcription-repair coupling factor [Deltaproteobacteria bacterium]|nr:transcription-repair coupling factor [Candidatus Anaeroferrophillus wilburensis]MBN2890128.1 transcription-repair coupling factor [Deltaproteobacteria bacterium]